MAASVGAATVAASRKRLQNSPSVSPSDVKAANDEAGGLDQAAAGSYVIVNSGRTAISSSSRLGLGKIGELRNGEVVKVLGTLEVEEDQRVRALIRYGSRTGWISVASSDGIKVWAKQLSESQAELLQAGTPTPVHCAEGPGGAGKGSDWSQAPRQSGGAAAGSTGRQPQTAAEQIECLKELLWDDARGPSLMSVTLLCRRYREQFGPLTMNSLKTFLRNNQSYFKMGWRFDMEVVQLAEEGSEQPAGRGAFLNSKAKKRDPSDEMVNGLSARSPPVVDTLARYALNYDRLSTRSHGVLGPFSTVDDVAKLTAAFDQYIRNHGLLSADFVRAEIDSACRLRGETEAELFKDRHVGALLAGVAKMLLLVDATVLICCSTQVLLTLYDLECAILRHRIFWGKERFEDHCLGKLQFHPEVTRRFGLDGLKEIPAEFPDISAHEIAASLFSDRLLDGHRRGKARSRGRYQPRAISVAQRLQRIASQHGLPDYRMLGIYVQDDSLIDQMGPSAVWRNSNVTEDIARKGRHRVATALAEWTAMTGHKEHCRFLQKLAELGDPAARGEFIRALELAAPQKSQQPSSGGKGEQSDKQDGPVERKKRWLKSETDKYVRNIFFKLLRQSGASPKAAAEAKRSPDEEREKSEDGDADVTQVSVHVHDEEMHAKLAGELAEIARRAAASGSADSPAPGTRLSHSALLTAVGRGEEELCRRLGVSQWSEAGLDCGFGAFVARHSDQLSASVGPLGSFPGLERDATMLRQQLLRDGLEEASVARAIYSYFGALLGPGDLQAVVAGSEAGSSEEADVPSAGHGGPVVQLASALAARGLHDALEIARGPAGNPAALASEALDVLRGVPPLLDLAEAVPSWPSAFGHALGSLPSFLRSHEFAAAAARGGKGIRVLEVRRGLFVRLPTAPECTLSAFEEALEAQDPPRVAAIALGLFLEESPPAEALRAAATRRYGGWAAEGDAARTAELFLLRAVAALPREAPSSLLRVLGSGYMALQRPRQALSDAAVARFGSERLLTVAVSRLGRCFGVPEWSAPLWDGLAADDPPPEAAKSGTTDAAAGPREVRAAHVARGSSTSPRERAADGSAPPAEVKHGAAAEEPQQINERVCADIARLKKVDFRDVDPSTRTWLRKPADEGIRSLHRTVQGAVKRLSEDLYSGDAHYLLELIQNVDDCTYPEESAPELQITYESRQERFEQLTSFGAGTASPSAAEALLVFEHNEVGFKENNVRAICDIDQSTKAAAEKRFIGAKGIGFKSVFLVTSTPILHSGPFNFHFDADALEGLGSLLPFRLPAPQTQSAGTRLVLPLRSSSGPLQRRQLSAKDVARRALRDIRPTLLLFLRRLETIRIDDSEARFCKEMSRRVTALQGPGFEGCQEVELSTLETARDSGGDSPSPMPATERWLVHTTELHPPTHGDRELARTELQLAFRLDVGADGAGTQQQEAFAWLPLRRYGLSFIVQADWRVPSSREAIIENDPFNQHIREKIPAAFASAALAFAASAVAASGGWLRDSLEGRAPDWPSQPKGPDGQHVPTTSVDLKASDGPAARGSANTEAKAAEQAAASALAPLYAALPNRTDAVDFFKPVPERVLQMLQEVACVMVRVGGGGYEGEGEGGANSEAEPPRPLALARPRKAVQPELCKRVPAVLGPCLRELEVLMNGAGRYFVAGSLPKRVADALDIPVVDTRVAMECLDEFSRRQSEEGRKFCESQLRTLRLLLMVIAFEDHPPIERLRSLRIVPVADGSAVAASEAEVYDIPADLAAALTGMRRLNPTFGQMAREERRLGYLLERMGVQSMSGPGFFEKVLLPRLARKEAPPARELVGCTAALRYLLACSDAEDAARMVRRLRSGPGWWVLSTAGNQGEPLPVRFGADGQPALHLEPLPNSLRSVAGSEGKPGSHPALRWLAPAADYAEATELEQLEKHEEERPQLDWGHFWLQLGAWPAFSIDTIRSMEDDGEDYASEELEALLASVRSLPVGPRRKLAAALAVFLAPHGPFYAKFLWRPDDGESSLGPSSVAKALMRQAWFPTRDGGVAAPTSGWLAAFLKKTPELAAGETRFLFTRACAKFAEAWPDLGIEKLPSGPTVVGTLRGMASHPSERRLSVAHMAALYAHLHRRRERTAIGVLASLALSPASVESFLAKEPWVFVPDHPRPHGRFKDAIKSWSSAAAVKGDFYRPRDLVFGDTTFLLDTFSSPVADNTSDVVREAIGKRVVGNYYMGPRTVFPSSLQEKRDKFTHQLHDLMRSCGVQDELVLDDYVKVLKRLDGMDASDRNEHRVIVSRVLEHLFWTVSLEQSMAEEMDEDRAPLPNSHAGLELRPSGPIARASRGLLQGAPSLRRFLEATAPLHFVKTAAGSWRALQRVLFTDNVLEEGAAWLPEALELVAAPDVAQGPQSAQRTRRALRMCGLSHTCAPFLARRAVSEPLREMEARQFAKVARELLELAVEQAAPELRVMGDGLPGSDDLVDCVRQAARSITICPAASLQVGRVIAVDEELADICGLEPLGGVPKAAAQFVCSMDAPWDNRARVAVARVEPPRAKEVFVGCQPETGSAVWAYVGSSRAGLAAAERSQDGTTLSAAIASSAVAMAEEYVAITEEISVLLREQIQESLRLADAQGVPNEVALEQATEARPSDTAGEEATPSDAAGEESAEGDLASPGSWSELLERFEGQDVLRALQDSGDDASLHAAKRAMQGEGKQSAIDADELLKSAWQALSPQWSKGGRLTVAREANLSGKPRKPHGESGDADSAEASQASVSQDSGTAEGPLLQNDGQTFDSISPFEVAAEGAPKDAPAGGVAGQRLNVGEVTLARKVRPSLMEVLGGGDGKSKQPQAVRLHAENTALRMNVDQELCKNLLKRGFQQEVGEIGEQLAARSLEKHGFEVLWINEAEELGMPFDLVAIPSRANLDQSQQGPAELLRGCCDTNGKPLPGRIAALLEQRQAICVEVKSNAKSKNAFKVTMNEVRAMEELGQSYWLMRVTMVSSGEPQVRVWRDFGQAVRDGEVELVMVDSWS